MKIICISGHAGAGKDTLASILKEKLEKQEQRVLIIHQADLLKFLCRLLFEWDGQKDERGRSLLQYVGTDVVRRKRPDFWVNFLRDVFDLFGDNWDYALIPDCRFPNEISRLRDAGYPTIHVRVERDVSSSLTDAQKTHPSETALDDVLPDYTVWNNGSIHELYQSVSIEVIEP